MNTEIITTYGTKIIIYHMGNEAETIDRNLFIKCLSEIRENIKSFTDDKCFSDLVINIWDERHPDIKPDLLYPTLGLTGQNAFDFNDMRIKAPANPSDAQYISDVLSHEFGHHWAIFAGFNNENSMIKRLWNAIRGKDSIQGISTRELIAEDFRYFFGSNLSRFVRGNHKSPALVTGLKNLYASWQKVNEIEKAINFFQYIADIKVYPLSLRVNIATKIIYFPNYIIDLKV